jgi:hypothetical protein
MQAYMTSNLDSMKQNGRKYNMMGLAGMSQRKNGAQVVESFNRRNTALI